MSTARLDVWARVRALRLAFADQVDALGDDEIHAASWCEGWRVREVLGHLVHLAEATQASMARDVVHGGVLPDRALDRCARRLAERPPVELTSRLRAAADGRFHVLGSPSVVALGEVLVHGNDALRPLDRALDGEPADAGAVLDVYVRIGRLAFHRRQARGVRLAADDLAWAAGSGPEVRGRAVDLLLLLANRPQVVPALRGPGTAGLGGR